MLEKEAERDGATAGGDKRMQTESQALPDAGFSQKALAPFCSLETDVSIPQEKTSDMHAATAAGRRGGA